MTTEVRRRAKRARRRGRPFTAAPQPWGMADPITPLVAQCLEVLGVSESPDTYAALLRSSISSIANATMFIRKQESIMREVWMLRSF